MLSTRVTNDLAQQACIDAHIGNGLDRCMEARTIALRGKPPRTEDEARQSRQQDEQKRAK